MELFYREFGKGSPLIILHGLLGSSDNWVTLAKVFSQHFHVYLLDQRNHGQSFHSDDFNYDQLSIDLDRFIEDNIDGSVSLLGHSMGGKVIMQYSLQHPENVSKLIVADMAPKKYKVDYDLIFTALNAVDLETISSRNEAEKIVSSYIEDFGMRQFLLKNLTRSDRGYQWKANLKAIQNNIQKMGDWSVTDKKFNGPTLFISGSKSGYLKENDQPMITEFFPKAHFESLDAGHWLHAEKPNEFMTAALLFLND